MSIEKYKTYLADGADGMDDFPRSSYGCCGQTKPIDPEENQTELNQIKRDLEEIEVMTKLEKGEDAETAEENFSGIVFVVFKYPKNCQDILDQQNTGIVKFLSRVICFCAQSKQNY